MPMFDDPNKELRRLQKELLAEEDGWEEDDELAGIEELLRDYEDESEESYEDCFEEDYEEEYEEYQRPTNYRNYANDYGRRMTEALQEEERDADRTLYRDDYRKAKRKRSKGIRGLLILACLETAAILAILGWWMTWLL